MLRNAVTPVALRLLGDNRSFGLDADHRLVHGALDWFAQPLASLDLRVAGLRVLELGPGRTRDVAGAFVLAGASEVVGLDTVVRVPPEETWTAHRADMLDWLCGAGGARFRESVGVTSDGVRRRAEELVGQPFPVRFQAYGGDELPLPDDSVDLVLSKSVLEHVRVEAVGPLLAELRRVLKPDGAMVHLIDLRDPTRVIGDDDVDGDWLTALRYSDATYRAMFSHRSTLINRLREPQWHRAILGAGFRIEHWDLRRLRLPAGFDPATLHEPWRGYQPSDLDVGWITMAARRL